MKLDLMKKGLGTKKEIQTAAKEAAQSVSDEGLKDPVKLLLQARRIKEFADSFAKGIESAVRTECAQQGGKLVMDNAELSLGSSGDTLDYQADPEYLRMWTDLKNREVLLKTARKLEETLVTEDGETIMKVPLKAAGKETLYVKF